MKLVQPFSWRFAPRWAWPRRGWVGACARRCARPCWRPRSCPKHTSGLWVRADDSSSAVTPLRWVNGHAGGNRHPATAVVLPAAVNHHYPALFMLTLIQSCLEVGQNLPSRCSAKTLKIRACRGGTRDLKSSPFPTTRYVTPNTKQICGFGS